MGSLVSGITNVNECDGVMVLYVKYFLCVQEFGLKKLAYIDFCKLETVKLHVLFLCVYICVASVFKVCFGSASKLSQFAFWSFNMLFMLSK
jgi:hypothetical protein